MAAMKMKSAMKAKKSAKKSGGKRALNPYFQAMLKAKKDKAPQFTYNGKVYKQKTLKTGMVVYKAK